MGARGELIRKGKTNDAVRRDDVVGGNRALSAMPFQGEFERFLQFA